MRYLAVLLFSLTCFAAQAGEITKDMPIGSVTDKSRATIAAAPARAVALTFCAFQVDALARLAGAKSTLPENTTDIYVIAEKLMPEGNFTKLTKELEKVMDDTDVFTQLGSDRFVVEHEECEKKALAIAKPYDESTPAPKKP